MTITVVTEHATDAYETATKWVIDDNECLHIIGDGGNLASYYRGVWYQVARNP